MSVSKEKLAVGLRFCEPVSWSYGSFRQGCFDPVVRNSLKNRVHDPVYSIFKLT